MITDPLIKDLRIPTHWTCLSKRSAVVIAFSPLLATDSAQVKLRLRQSLQQIRPRTRLWLFRNRVTDEGLRHTRHHKTQSGHKAHLGAIFPGFGCDRASGSRRGQTCHHPSWLLREPCLCLGSLFGLGLTRYLDRIMHLRCCYWKRAISHIRDYLCNDDFYQLQPSCINQTYKGHPEGESKAISEALSRTTFSPRFRSVDPSNAISRPAITGLISKLIPWIREEWKRGCGKMRTLKTPDKAPSNA